jgi:flavin reductase (DIM6/NTAB) family NADH-FMN oxidoreductase RutF
MRNRIRPIGDDGPPPPLHPALTRIPRSRYVLTASFEGRRAGLCVDLVQVAAALPPSVSLALPKGRPISPLVRDARCFGLCQVEAGDRFWARKFPDEHPGDPELQSADPFDGVAVVTHDTGAPLLARALTWLDCRVTMHIDFDSDHELYIAEVVGAALNSADGSPLVRIAGDDG